MGKVSLACPVIIINDSFLVLTRKFQEEVKKLEVSLSVSSWTKTRLYEGKLILDLNLINH